VDDYWLLGILGMRGQENPTLRRIFLRFTLFTSYLCSLLLRFTRGFIFSFRTLLLLLTAICDMKIFSTFTDALKNFLLLFFPYLLL